MLEEPENPVSWDYYDIHDPNEIQIHQHDLSIIHLNISSLASHIHKLKLFLSLLKVSFDIICIFESRISKHNLPTININKPGYNNEHTPIKQRNLDVYLGKKLASMNVSTFNAEFFVPFLKNLNKENKEVTSTGDFNMNLLNFAKKRGTHQFLELFQNNYTPEITRLATLINNIFLNTQHHKRTSGNITTSISDHLHQFTILDKFLATRNITGKEQITYRDFKNLSYINT